jgi:hypothetical protein
MAIKHDPKFTEAFFAKSICLRDLNSLEEALAVNDMAFKHNPNHSLAINNRKDLLERLKSK